jgi:uncharacterized membrane protein YgcG
MQPCLTHRHLNSVKHIAIIVWLICCVSCRAAEVIPPTPAQYFNDYANLVSRETAGRLNQTLEEFERATSRQILVAILPKKQSDSTIDDYATRVIKAWKLGLNEKNNWAILFVFIQERETWIAAGSGLEQALSNVVCKRILDNEIAPRFKQDDYKGGLSAGVSAMIAAVSQEELWEMGTGTIRYSTNPLFASASVVPRESDVAPVQTLTGEIIARVISLPGQQFDQLRLPSIQWHYSNNCFVTNYVKYPPFDKVTVHWDNNSGKIERLMLLLSVDGRLPYENEPYGLAKNILTKHFGPPDTESSSLLIMSISESEWQLPGKGIFLKRTPHRNGDRETFDYALSVIGNFESSTIPITGAFGFKLGQVMPKELLSAGRRLETGIQVGVFATRPHPLLATYVLYITPRSVMIYSINGLYSGGIMKVGNVYKALLKEVRTGFDWDECSYTMTHLDETIRTEKSDKSIAVEYLGEQDDGECSVLVRFVDELLMDKAMIESKTRF